MTLDSAYLVYPKRRQGYDHEIYDWSALHTRAPVAWPGGKSVSIWICVSLEYFPLVPNDAPFRAPGHMQTPYPDYRHFTARDYGTRVGMYRLLDIFAKLGVRVSVATNAAIAIRYPQLIADILAGGHEIIAHSTDMNGTIATGLDEAEERRLIVESADVLEGATGTRARGWLSIARSQSWHTPQLLRDTGFVYACDWVNDELPYRFRNGLVNLPLNHELSDRQILTVQQQSVDSYVQQVRDAYDWLAHEAVTYGGRLLPLHVTPYIIGLPYRIDAFEQLLTDLLSRSTSWIATGDEIVRAWDGQQ